MKDTANFGEMYEAAKGDFKLRMKLSQHFMDEMDKAQEGRICTPERMAALYPIFREINDEQDEIEAYWRSVEAKAIRRQEKKQLALTT